VIAKKAEMDHALMAEIVDGHLRCVSRYTYRGEANRLSHDRLGVTIKGKTVSAPAASIKTIAPATGAGVGVEEAELSDIAPLRFIASNPAAAARVQVENRDGFFRSFDLDAAAHGAIVQTVELCDALDLLRKEGADRRLADDIEAPCTTAVSR
jgi:hypothetical protein